MISYEPLWTTLAEKGWNKMELFRAVKMSSATFSKLAKNECVSLNNLAQICLALHCQLESVVRIEKN